MHSATARPRRALSLLLALVLLLGLVPGLPGGEEASAHWADPYLSQLIEWGFIRADQAETPNKALTRADFMSIVNRAYGYHEVGVTPFEDVDEKDWYYDDVGIAYNARYIHGTSPTTASPNDTLTRETAATILGRNMMLQESAGEILDFSDARDISNWSRGTIKSSLEHYLVSGYDDGTFRPQKDVTWGEMAALISRTVGTPLQEAGDYSLGGVFGNVTVTAPGVTLRDTVISGDLYITGGVGTGNIKLENVTVLGRIIASGSGESEGGEASILLRNVTADELLVDNLQDNYVTVKADGVTDIGRTTVRTSAYIEDNTPDGMGLKYISLEGETYPEGEEPEDWEPIQLDLAGRIEEVVNRTPNSQVKAAKGTVAKLTVDETATGSTVVIDRGAEVKELNLDTGTIVTGEGDIEKLVVNAPGSDVAMLPDQIVIRPGITAIINGVEMDSVAAEESSMDPMILSGYPQATDIAPTSVQALFSTNKRGTIYWAVSAITDGSVGEDALIKPPSYGNIALRNGSLLSPRGNEETTANITGLTPDGSYYLSAVLVDDRGQRSPTKVISFTTPDNTVPAFAQGYPHMSKVSRRESVAVVMPTKDCKLYYALLPRAAQAPTVNELKAGAVSGALGYGVQDVFKNVESAFRVNDRVLEEQTDYTVYFWLTDANGVNSSAVVPLTFTTADETPPTFTMGPLAGKGKDNSVPVTFRLSEDGTVFWAVVPEGEPYPRALNGQTGTAPLDSMEAKLQVSSGQGALSHGSVSASAARDGNFNVTGLEPEKAYDLYYVAQDKAGNYSLTVGKITINTADSTGPIVKLLSKNPRVSDPIVLEFSENVRPDANGPVAQDLLSLYKATLTAADKEQAKKNLRDALTYMVELYQRTQGTGTGDVMAKSRPYPYDSTNDWVIDFSQAVVSTAKDGSGKIEVTIPATGHQLKSAGTYYFRIQNLTDNAGNRLNKDLPQVDYSTDSKLGHDMPIFTVVFAEIYLAQIPPVAAEELPKVTSGTGQNATTTTIQPDVFFRMIPQTTSSVVPGRTYDLLMFTNKTMRFELYYRVVDTTKAATVEAQDPAHPDDPTKKVNVPNPERYPTKEAQYVKNMPGAGSATLLGDYGWVKLDTDSSLITNGNDKGEPKVGVSLQAQFNESDDTPELRDLDDSKKVYYEFAIRVLQIGEDGIDKRETWGSDLQMEIHAAAATPTSMRNLTISKNAITEGRWEDYKGNGLAANNGAVDVGRTDTADSFLTMDIPFPSTGNPKFDADTPKLTPGDTYVKMELAPDIECKIYYVIAPVGGITTTVSTGAKPGGGMFSNGELLEKNNLAETPGTPPVNPGTADNTAGVFEENPAMTSTSTGGSKLKVKPDETGTLYYVLLPGNHLPLAAAQIKAGGVTDQLAQGSLAVTDGTEAEITLNLDTGKTLTAGSSYKIYFCLNNGTTDSNVATLTFEATAPSTTTEPVRGPYKGPYVPEKAMVNDPNVVHEADTDRGWVTNPSNLSIWHPRYNSPSIKISSAPDPENPGKTLSYLPYPGGGYTWPETVTGLEPETDYYAYFVLESLVTERPSRVYLYTFRTGKISNPRIRLDREGSGVVYARTDKDSNLRWTMYAEQDLKKISILWEKLTDHLAEGYTATSPEIANYKNYTVFEALTRPATLDYSVFDLYVDKGTKETVFGTIGTGTTVGGTTSIGGGEIHTKLGSGADSTLDTIDNRYEGTGNKREPKMKPGTQYIVLAMACHENGDPEDYRQHSFKAIDNVFVPDDETPVVDRLSTSITGYDSVNRTYSGSFTIGFSKPVYWTDDGAKAWDIHATSPTTAGGTIAGDGTNYKELMNYVSGSAKRYLYFDASNRPITPQTSYTIYFSNMPSGTDLTLFSSGDVANSSAGRDMNAQLNIRFTAYPTRPTENVSGFTGTWKGQNVKDTTLSDIPASSSSGGDVAIYFIKNSTDNVGMETPNTQPTVKLEVSKTFTATATVATDAPQKLISWRVGDGGNSDSVASITGSITNEETITAVGIGETTVSIDVTIPGSRDPSYKTIRVIVTDPNLDIASPTKSSADTKSISYNSTTKTIAWEREPGKLPTQTLTLADSVTLGNAWVEWVGDDNVIKVTRINDKSAQMAVLRSGEGKVTINVKVGNTIIQSTEITVTVTGNDTGINISNNPIIR